MSMTNRSDHISASNPLRVIAQQAYSAAQTGPLLSMGGDSQIGDDAFHTHSKPRFADCMKLNSEHWHCFSEMSLDWRKAPITTPMRVTPFRRRRADCIQHWHIGAAQPARLSLASAIAFLAMKMLICSFGPCPQHSNLVKLDI